METQMAHGEMVFRPTTLGGRNSFYISSGKKNAQYTLRARFEEQDHTGAMVTRDQYVCNLGIDLDRALTKAALEAGEPVAVEEFQLNPYGETTEEEKTAAALREKHRSEQEAIQADYDATAAEKMRLRREEDGKSLWQGVVGERITRALTCLRWIPTGEGMYGMRYVAIFRDADFNKYVFFGGSVASLPNEGDTVTVSFLVDQHSAREGCKQTVMKRPSKVKGAA